jgi:hypothetical protein
MPAAPALAGSASATATGKEPAVPAATGPTVPLGAAATTTVPGSLVTLQPTGPTGRIPGDASDPSDFYGLGVAVIGIVLAIVLARWLLRGHGGQSRGER